MEPAAQEDLTAREAEAWASFEEAVNAVPRDRRTEPSLPEGWSVKDMLWHVAHWWEKGAARFERMTSGAEVEGDPGDTDEINARALAESRAMSLDDVEAGIARTRERLLRAWAPVSEDPGAAETFAGETIEHYEEHAVQLTTLTSREP